VTGGGGGAKQRSAPAQRIRNDAEAMQLPYTAFAADMLFSHAIRENWQYITLKSLTYSHRGHTEQRMFLPRLGSCFLTSAVEYPIVPSYDENVVARDLLGRVSIII
jgi:hypothetical protein